MAEVIKAAEAEALQDLTVYALDSMEQAAMRLLAEARLQAQALRARAQQELDQARAEAEALRAQARAQGHAEGLEAGRAEGLAQGRQQGAQEAHEETLRVLRPQASRLLAALERLVAELHQQRHQLYKQALDACLKLACRIAERIIRREVRLDPSIVETSLAAALELATCHGTVTVAVSPSDLETARRFLPTLESTVRQAQGFQVVADERVEPGGCRITTDRGEVDARLSQQVANIERQLLGPAEPLE